jgi:hypothetical protein
MKKKQEVEQKLSKKCQPMTVSKNAEQLVYDKSEEV